MYTEGEFGTVCCHPTLWSNPCRSLSSPLLPLKMAIHTTNIRGIFSLEMVGGNAMTSVFIDRENLYINLKASERLFRLGQLVDS